MTAKTETAKTETSFDTRKHVQGIVALNANQKTEYGSAVRPIIEHACSAPGLVTERMNHVFTLFVGERELATSKQDKTDVGTAWNRFKSSAGPMLESRGYAVLTWPKITDATSLFELASTETAQQIRKDKKEEKQAALDKAKSVATSERQMSELSRIRELSAEQVADEIAGLFSDWLQDRQSDAVPVLIDVANRLGLAKETRDALTASIRASSKTAKTDKTETA